MGYVGLANGEVNAVDLNRGLVLERLRLPNNPNIQDVAISRNTLFVLAVGRLFALPLDEGELRVSSSVDSPGGVGAGQRRLRLFVADGLAYASHTAGFNVLDVSDRENLRSLRVNNTSSFGWKQMVPNGSGLGIACVSPNSTDDGPHHVSLYNLGNDGLGSAFLTTLQTPGLATAAALYNGLAYIADGRAGLQVLNYLAYDAGNQPPTIRLAADFPLDPPQAEEGKLVTVTARVSDDVQVARVEFYVDGNRIAVDGNYPFESVFVTPLLGPNQTSFRLRARAFDTGGNFAWSTEYTVNLVPDATAPRIIRRFPASGAIVGSTDTVAAYFSEPIDTATLTTASVRVIAAGSDGVLGTTDDIPRADFTADYRSSLNALFLPFPAALAPGLYQVQIRPPIADLAGNPLAAPAIWNFWVLGQEDRDNDGVPDNIEEALGLDPNNPDTNGNGILDGDEDPDRDGLRTGWELLFGYDPRLQDSDGNGVTDANEDPDADGLKNLDEQRYGTHPLLGDSDADGWDDLGEVLEGTDPANGFSQPQLLVASTSASFLNALPDGAPSGTPLHVTSPVTSYLNATAETLPAGTPVHIISPVASFLNAVAETLAPGTPVQFLSPVVSYLNAESETTPERFSVSPVVSYHNQ